MSVVDLCVVCNADAESESWPSYIIQQASSTSSASSRVSSRTLLDADLSRPGSANTLQTARVVVVVASSGHLDYLSRCARPAYGACSPERGLILLCGVDDRDLEQPTSSGRKVSDHFPRYSRWKRVPHDVEQSVLTETLSSLMSTEPKEVTLLQTTARCEENTLMVLTFAEQLPAASTVHVVLSNSAADEEASVETIAASRVNPYTYTFIAPSERNVGEVSVDVRVNERIVASLSMTYVSAGPLVADVGQVYMHLLNTVCNHLVSQKNVAVGTLDEKLSSLFDDDVTSTVPAQAFEQLFGAHRYDVDMDKDFELPTLIHFAAKFGFKELCARLIDLPDASYAGKFSNCNGQQPNEIAKVYRHQELCRFLDNFLEMDKEFESMYITYYNDKGDTAPGGGRYQNAPPARQEGEYMRMDGRHRLHPATSLERKESTPIVEDEEAVYTQMSVTAPSASAVAKRALTHTTATKGVNSHIPVEQKELIDIMELVKAKKITQAQAEKEFRLWKTKHEAGPARSFREKQERLAKMNEAVRQARNETQKPRENVRLSDTSVGSRSSTASRSSATSGIETDYEDPEEAPKPPPPVPVRGPPKPSRPTNR